jgi:hypothetical protein
LGTLGKDVSVSSRDGSHERCNILARLVQQRIAASGRLSGAKLDNLHIRLVCLSLSA